MSTDDLVSFSVIMPVRNLQSRLRQTLSSLLPQIQENPDFELWIGDDASEDGSSQIALELIQSQARIHHWQAPHHLGRAAIRNQLCQMARGSRFIFLDGDCIPNPNWCNAIRIGTSAHPSANFVAQVRYQNENSSGFAKFLSQHSGPARLNPSSNLPCAYFTTGNSVVIAKAFLNVGGFRESFVGWGGEDYDLGLRLEQAGNQLAFCHGAWVLHEDIKSVWPYLERLRHFGSDNLHRLIQDYPEKIDIFHVNLLQNPFIKFIFSCFPLFICFRYLLAKTDFIPWPVLFYRTAIFSAYTQGFLLKSDEIVTHPHTK